MATQNINGFDRQLIKNAIEISEKKGLKAKLYLIAFLENDQVFINEFNRIAEKNNEFARSEGLHLHVDFDGQIEWAVKAFREVKEIRELCC